MRSSEGSSSGITGNTRAVQALQTRAGMRVRYLVPLVVLGLGALAAACTSSSLDDGGFGESSSSSSSSGYGTSGKTGRKPASSGTDTSPPYPGSSGYPYPGSSSSSGWIDGGPAYPGSLDVAFITSFTVGTDTCLHPAGTCGDRQSFTVDLLASTLTTITCVEVGGAPDGGGGTVDAKTSKKLSPDQIATLRDLLLRVVVGPSYGVDAGGLVNGPYESLIVTNKTAGSVSYRSSTSACGPEYLSVIAGWGDLYDAVRGM